MLISNENENKNSIACSHEAWFVHPEKSVTRVSYKSLCVWIYKYTNVKKVDEQWMWKFIISHAHIKLATINISWVICDKIIMGQSKMDTKGKQE